MYIYIYMYIYWYSSWLIEAIGRSKLYGGACINIMVLTIEQYQYIIAIIGYVSANHDRWLLPKLINIYVEKYCSIHEPMLLLALQLIYYGIVIKDKIDNILNSR